MYLQVEMTDNAHVDVAYTEASMEQVSAMVDLSAYCYQEVTYDCQDAPLNGDNGKTRITRLMSVYTNRKRSRFYMGSLEIQFVNPIQQWQRSKENFTFSSPRC